MFANESTSRSLSSVSNATREKKFRKGRKGTEVGTHATNHIVLVEDKDIITILSLLFSKDFESNKRVPCRRSGPAVEILIHGWDLDA